MKASLMHYTDMGTNYMREPGLALLSEPKLHFHLMRDFLQELGDWGPHGHPVDYLDDDWDCISDGAALAKIAGQVCYASFGNRRTRNAGGGAEQYLDRVMAQGHGSLLAHVNYTVLIYGISRALSHELVRHHVGTNFSQLSQRYAGPESLYFVEHPEIQRDPSSHLRFTREIDQHRTGYMARLEEAYAKYEGTYSGTTLRKKASQVARMGLPACTGTYLAMTFNMRALRNILEQRCAPEAELEFRVLAGKLYRLMDETCPELLSGMTLKEDDHGYPVVTSKWRKV